MALLAHEPIASILKRTVTFIDQFGSPTHQTFTEALKRNVFGHSEGTKSQVVWIPSQNGALFLALQSFCQSSPLPTEIYCSSQTRQHLEEHEASFHSVLSGARLITKGSAFDVDQFMLNLPSGSRERSRIVLLTEDIGLEKFRLLSKTLKERNISLHFAHHSSEALPPHIKTYFEHSDSFSLSISALLGGGDQGFGSLLGFSSSTQQHQYSLKLRPLYGDETPHSIVRSIILVGLKREKDHSASTSPLSLSEQEVSAPHDHYHRNPIQHQHSFQKVVIVEHIHEEPAQEEPVDPETIAKEEARRREERLRREREEEEEVSRARVKAEEERVQREKEEERRKQQLKEEAEERIQREFEQLSLARLKAEEERVQREKEEAQRKQKLKEEEEEREFREREAELARRQRESEEELKRQDAERRRKQEEEEEQFRREDQERRLREQAEFENQRSEREKLEEERRRKDREEEEEMTRIRLRAEEERINREREEEKRRLRLKQEEEDRQQRELEEQSRLRLKADEERIEREKEEERRKKRLKEEEEERQQRELEEASRLRLKAEEERIEREKEDERRKQRLREEKEEREQREREEQSRMRLRAEEERREREKEEERRKQRLREEEEEREERERKEIERKRLLEEEARYNLKFSPRPAEDTDKMRGLLTKLNLADYYKTFHEQEVDYDTLLELTEDDLTDLQIPVYVQTKLLKEIRQINPKNKPTKPVATSAKVTPVVVAKPSTLSPAPKAAPKKVNNEADEIMMALKSMNRSKGVF